MVSEWGREKLVSGLPGFIRGGALLLMLCGLLGRSVQAQSARPEMITDRPDRTEASYVVPRGLYTLALGISAFEKTGFFAEFFGDTALNGSTSAANNFDGGLTHLLRPNVQLDFAVGKGISSESLDWFFTLGVSFRLPY